MKKKLKIVVIALLFLLLTGCTETLKDGKEVVTNKETGQTLTSNILCKPEDKTLLETYEKYDKKLQVKLDDLPTCKTFTPNKLKYQSLWESLFVKPLAWIILKLGYLVKNMGISVMVIGLLIRLIMMPLQIKTVRQSENMKKAQPELDFLEKKYKNKQDSDTMMMKSQEMMSIYKKYDINPMSGCLFSLIQIPLFFAFYEALNRLPAVFEGKFLGFKMGMSPMNGISSGIYQYIIIIVLVILATFLSFKLNSTASMSKVQEGQMKMMTNMMLIFIGIASLSISTGIAIYWITNNTFTIIQNLLVKRSK